MKVDILGHEKNFVVQDILFSNDYDSEFGLCFLPPKNHKHTCGIRHTSKPEFVCANPLHKYFTELCIVFSHAALCPQITQ